MHENVHVSVRRGGVGVPEQSGPGLLPDSFRQNGTDWPYRRPKLPQIDSNFMLVYHLLRAKQLEEIEAEMEKVGGAHGHAAVHPAFQVIHSVGQSGAGGTTTSISPVATSAATSWF
ncbi:hypothetical protein [Dictyobacter arantiisoli]|uniref:Uncharacterized protein n=1 Tax=Dictyobacter arantiisoli TaxID=2014874 RepID=A0A5A5TJT5_9CHLR|nr:hypothetical protein [Dictyobacter arantiisoli]GCF11697.1 hypothetical protein KDI_52610 [Dictyobacter arantiisoli]